MKAAQNLTLRLSLALGIVCGALVTGSANNVLPWLVAVLISTFAFVMFLFSKN